MAQDKHTTRPPDDAEPNSSEENGADVDEQDRDLADLLREDFGGLAEPDPGAEEDMPSPPEVLEDVTLTEDDDRTATDRSSRQHDQPDAQPDAQPDDDYPAPGDDDYPMVEIDPADIADDPLEEHAEQQEPPAADTTEMPPLELDLPDMTPEDGPGADAVRHGGAYTMNPPRSERSRQTPLMRQEEEERAAPEVSSDAEHAGDDLTDEDAVLGDEVIPAKPLSAEEAAAIPPADGWEVTPTRRFSPFVLDMFGDQQLFTSDGVTRLDTYSDHTGYLTIIADFTESASAGVAEVRGKPKFADVMLRRKLEETGELTPDSFLHTYTVRKSGPDRSSAFYQVLPKIRAQSLHRAGQDHDGGYLVYDTMGALAGFLTTLHPKGHGAVAMPVDQALLLVAGTRGKVFAARRYPLIDSTRNSMIDGIFTMVRDLEIIQQLMGGRVQAVDWVVPMELSPDWEPPRTDPPVKLLPVNKIADADGFIWYSSLPPLVDPLPVDLSLGPRSERWLRPLEKAEPVLWALLVGVLVALSLYAFSLSADILDTEKQALNLQSQTRQIRSRLPQVEEYNVADLDLSPLLRVGAAMERVAFAPSLARVWDRLAFAKPPAMLVDSLSIQYPADAVRVSMSGRVELPLSQVQRVFHEYIQSLQRDGFVVDSQSIDLGFETNTFRLAVTLPAQDRGTP